MKITTDYMSKNNEEKKVVNQESAKVAIEQGNELTTTEQLNAYLMNHAVEHYCAALGEDEEEVNTILAACKKEEGEYWLFTQPAIDGKKADGTPLPTREEWEKANTSAVRVDMLAGKQWYKRPFVIGDARGVKSIVNAYERYNEAVAGAQKKMQNMAEGGKLAFSTMSREEKAAYLAELQKMLGD